MIDKSRPLQVACLALLLLAPALPAGAPPVPIITDAPDKSEQVLYIVPGVLSMRLSYNVATVITCTNLSPVPFSPTWEFYRMDGSLFLSTQPYILLAGTTHVLATQAIPSIEGEINLDINISAVLVARIVVTSKTAVHCMAQLYRSFAVNGPPIITPLAVIPVTQQKFKIK